MSIYTVSSFLVQWLSTILTVEKRGAREKEINEKERWMKCMDVADSAGILPFPSFFPLHLSDPHLYCRVMALGSTTILQGEDQKQHNSSPACSYYRIFNVITTPMLRACRASCIKQGPGTAAIYCCCVISWVAVHPTTAYISITHMQLIHTFTHKTLYNTSAAHWNATRGAFARLYACST